MFIAGIELFFGLLAGAAILFTAIYAVTMPYHLIRAFCGKRTAQ